jgi:redox-sensitive bicupin YhaK (pirin superfamily)
MVEIRRSQERGHVNHGWLNTYHTFSFDEYYDSRFVHFRSLRVLNDDRVAPGTGFPMHSHRDMEIVTYVLEGALQHRDNMGNGSVIRPGDVQRMSAGTGVSHSEFNPSLDEPVHLLQIWIFPEKKGLAPEYEQKTFPASEKRARLRLVASPDGRDGSVTIHQDAAIYAAQLAAGEHIAYDLSPERHAWVQVARGRVQMNGESLEEGDGAAISSESRVELTGAGDAEVLLFDLA